MPIQQALISGCGSATVATKLYRTADSELAVVVQVVNLVHIGQRMRRNGAVFLARNPNPHYAQFELEGGTQWMRERLISGSVPVPQAKPVVV